MTKKIIPLICALLISTSVFSQKKKVYKTFKTDNLSTYDICFSKKGGVLAATDDKNIKVFSTKNQSLLSEFKNGHTNRILAIDISNDSTLLVSGGMDSTIIVWDFVQNKILKTLKFQKSVITSLKLSPDAKFLLSGGSDGKAYFYNLKEDKLVSIFENHSGEITAVKFSSDGRFLATAGTDKNIIIYSGDNYKTYNVLKGHKKWVRDICFNSNITKLISCGDDSQLISWNISNLSKAIKISSMRIDGWLLCLDLNEDDKTFITGNENGTVNIQGTFYKNSVQLNSCINKVLFVPHTGALLKFVVATLGKGLLIVDTKDLKN